MTKYKYKRVKIDSREALILQSQGHTIINTDPYSGYVQFEIEES